jgi:peroxiredoxin
MFQVRRLWTVVMAVGFALATFGCSSNSSPEAARKPSGKDMGGRGEKRAAKGPERHKQPVVQPKRQEPPLPPPPATMPTVNLSDELRANCLVKVGDVMPKTDQLDINGKTQSLASLYGKKLTVVCFWTAVDRRSALETANILRSLTGEIAKPFADKGVQVIGIELARNDVDKAAWESVRKAVSELPFPCLSDGKGQYLAYLCKDDKVPRVYLLDAKGKILWFDVEYSRSTREDLVQGIRVALGDLK